MDFIDKFLSTHLPKLVTINGVEKYYIVGGSGKTAFLIFPGSGQDALSCYDLINKIEKKYKVIAINYAGFYNINSFFDYVNAILEQEKIERIILYGLSLGGFLAQHYVRKFKDNIDFLILSHSGTTKSKSIIWRVAIPGKILYFFIPLIPQRVLNTFFKPVAGRVQSGNSNVLKLYETYSSKENLQRRRDFAKKTSFSLINKNYLKTVYHLGVEMEKLENKFTQADLKNWTGKILIIRTDNDPLAQDDGMFNLYYPNAHVVTFRNTGHLTPFIQFENMARKIHQFLK